MSVVCGQRSCFDRAQTAWPSVAQRTAPTEAHASVYVCVRTSVFICCPDGDITSRMLERLTLRNLTQHFVGSGKWRLVSFVFVFLVRHMPWWLWWCWWFVIVDVSVAQFCIYVRADWTAYWPVTKAAQVQKITSHKREEKRKSKAASSVKRHS